MCVHIYGCLCVYVCVYVCIYGVGECVCVWGGGGGGEVVCVLAH